ncbi:MAG: AMP-binding protein [Flavobacteriaceae bacterium]
MIPDPVRIHPDFSLNGVPYNRADLLEIGYSFIKEGRSFEQPIGDFFLDWLSETTDVLVKTSGSTADARSIRLSKDAMAQSARSTADFFNLDPGTSALHCLPADHIAGKMMLVRAMTLGWNLDIVEPSTTPLLGLQKTYDFCAMVPMQLRRSIRDIGRIKTLIVGGAPLQSDLIKTAQDLSTSIFETYGMTETTSHIALKPINGPAGNYGDTAVDIFTALPGIVLSQDKRGCLGMKVPWLNGNEIITNDLVELASPTEFKWLGRWDNIVNSGGIKLIPEKIEKQIDALIEGRFIVLGLPDKELGQKLVLVVEGTGNGSSLATQIQKLKGLDPYEVPREIHFIEHFPETPNAKINRRQLLSQLSDSTTDL